VNDRRTSRIEERIPEVAPSSQKKRAMNPFFVPLFLYAEFCGTTWMQASLRGPMIIDLAPQLLTGSRGGEVGGSEPIRIPTTQILLAPPGVYRVHAVTSRLRKPTRRFTPLRSSLTSFARSFPLRPQASRDKSAEQAYKMNEERKGSSLWHWSSLMIRRLARHERVGVTHQAFHWCSDVPPTA
jgi:hypothetical protein